LIPCPLHAFPCADKCAERALCEAARPYLPPYRAGAFGCGCYWTADAEHRCPEHFGEYDRPQTTELRDRLSEAIAEIDKVNEALNEALVLARYLEKVLLEIEDRA